MNPSTTIEERIAHIVALAYALGDANEAAERCASTAADHPLFRERVLEVRRARTALEQAVREAITNANQVECK